MKYFCINCLEHDGNVSILSFIELGELHCNTCGQDVVDNMPCFTQEEMTQVIKFSIQGCPREDKEFWQGKLDEVTSL